VILRSTASTSIGLCALVVLFACSSDPTGPSGSQVSGNDTGWEWVAPRPTGNTMTAATTTPDGALLLGTEYGEIFEWTPAGARRTGHLPDGSIVDLEVAPEGRIAAVAGRPGNSAVWIGGDDGRFDVVDGLTSDSWEDFVHLRLRSVPSSLSTRTRGRRPTHREHRLPWQCP